MRGIAGIRPHEPLRRIAEAIEPFAASRGYGVIREYGGHGSGRATFPTACDGWTEHADADCISAQFEHTVLVTDHGAEILTITADGRTAVGTLDDIVGRVRSRG